MGPGQTWGGFGFVFFGDIFVIFLEIFQRFIHKLFVFAIFYCELSIVVAVYIALQTAAAVVVVVVVLVVVVVVVVMMMMVVVVVVVVVVDTHHCSGINVYGCCCLRVDFWWQKRIERVQPIKWQDCFANEMTVSCIHQPIRS